MFFVVVQLRGVILVKEQLVTNNSQLCLRPVLTLGIKNNTPISTNNSILITQLNGDIEQKPALC